MWYLVADLIHSYSRWIEQSQFNDPCTRQVSNQGLGNPHLPSTVGVKLSLRVKDSIANMISLVCLSWCLVPKGATGLVPCSVWQLILIIKLWARLSHSHCLSNWYSTWQWNWHIQIVSSRFASKPERTDICFPVSQNPHLADYRHWPTDHCISTGQCWSLPCVLVISTAQYSSVVPTCTSII